MLTFLFIAFDLRVGVGVKLMWSVFGCRFLKGMSILLGIICRGRGIPGIMALYRWRL